MKVAEIKHNIESSLKVGAPYEEIESFLRENGMRFDFDRHHDHGRFQARLDRPVDSKDSNIAIYIYLDEERAFSWAEVKRIYTYL